MRSIQNNDLVIVFLHFLQDGLFFLFLRQRQGDLLSDSRACDSWLRCLRMSRTQVFTCAQKDLLGGFGLRVKRGEYWHVGFLGGGPPRLRLRALPHTRGTQLPLKCSPTRLPTNYPTTGTWNYGAPIG